MDLHELRKIKVSEIGRIYAGLDLCKEEQVANALVCEVLWSDMVIDYPDLTAEEIASAVCGGVGS